MSQWKKVEHNTFGKVDSQRTVYIDNAGNFNANVTGVVEISDGEKTAICDWDFLKSICCANTSTLGFLTEEEFDKHCWGKECLPVDKAKSLFEVAYQLRLLYYYEVPYCPYKKSLREEEDNR